MNAYRTAILFLILLAGAASTLRAHHGISGFAMTKPQTIEGTVAKFEWTNPHGYLYVEVKDGQGQAGIWRIEFGSIGNMRLRGLSKTFFNVGDVVRIVGSPRLDGFKEMLFREGSFADGRQFGRPNAGSR